MGVGRAHGGHLDRLETWSELARAGPSRTLAEARTTMRVHGRIDLASEALYEPPQAAACSLPRPAVHRDDF